MTHLGKVARSLAKMHLVSDLPRTICDGTASFFPPASYRVAECYHCVDELALGGVHEILH